MVKSVMLDSLRMLTPSWNGHTSHVRFIQTETVKSFMLSRSERRQLSRVGFTQNVDTPLKLSNESWSMYHRECARADRWNCQLNFTVHAIKIVNISSKWWNNSSWIDKECGPLFETVKRTMLDALSRGRRTRWNSQMIESCWICHTRPRPTGFVRSYKICCRRVCSSY